MKLNALRLVLLGVLLVSLSLVAQVPPLTPSFAQAPPGGLFVTWDEDWIPEGDQYGVELMPGNTLTLTVWYELPGYLPPNRATISLEMWSSNLEGQCTNSGELQLADFAIHDATNDADWDFTGYEVPEYNPAMYRSNTSGLMTIAETRPLLSGESVTLTITSFDWGGRCTLRFSTIESMTETIDIPRDEDMDEIPDVLEEPQPISAWYEDDDRDAEYLHLQWGDGLTAKDETRGVKVQGEVHRVDDLMDDGPLGIAGGVQEKNVWIFADGEPAGEGALTTLFPLPNEYLGALGVSHKVIAETDMKPGTFVRETDTTGLVRSAISGLPRQPPVWFRVANDMGPGRLGFSPNHLRFTKPTRINCTAIKAHATKYGITALKLLKWTVAHELGHQLALKHFKRLREYVASMPNDGGSPPTPVITMLKYWPVNPQPGDIAAPNQAVDCWTPVFVKTVAGVPEPFTLELLSETDTIDPTDENTVIVGGDKGVTTDRLEAAALTKEIHTAAHRVGRYRVYLGKASSAAMKIRFEEHVGNLMDPVCHPDEMDGVQKVLQGGQKASIETK